MFAREADMDGIERLSSFTLVACDQAYDTTPNSSLEHYPDSFGMPGDLYPASMPARFYDASRVGLSEWHTLERINDSTTGFGATIYARARDGKTDYMVALQGTRGPNPQDWAGNLQFGLDKWNASTGGQRLMADLSARLGEITGDIYFTGQSLGGALAEYAAYEFKTI